MKNISVLGSTGSIGIQTLQVIADHPRKYRVVGLTAGRKIDLLLEQISRHKPLAVAVLDEGFAATLRSRLPSENTRIFHGSKGFNRIATLEEADTVVSAISGAAGLLPTYEAIKADKTIALANKETIVMAGALMLKEARTRGIPVLPVDSEHSAIFQCLKGHRKDHVRRILLTASGGPFRGRPLETLKRVSPAQALNHPNWNMGPKITVDSATLMNKGLEVIEAKWLFGLSVNQISVLIHPQSIVHSMVEFRDGSMIAQLGPPDMKIPIAYALSYPVRMENPNLSLEMEQVGTLTFEKPDPTSSKCLRLAFEAARLGGSFPIVLNAANEVAVAFFLEERIGFLEIGDLVERVMEEHEPVPVEDLDAVLEVDRKTRNGARDMASKIRSN